MSQTRDVHPLTYCINSMAKDPNKPGEVESLLSRSFAHMQEPSIESKEMTDSPICAAITTLNLHALLWLTDSSKHPKCSVNENFYRHAIKGFLAYEDCNEVKESAILAKRDIVDFLIRSIFGEHRRGHVDDAVRRWSGHIGVAVTHKNYYFLEKVVQQDPEFVKRSFQDISSQANFPNLPYIVKLFADKKYFEIYFDICYSYQRHDFNYAVNQLLLNNDVSTADDFIYRGVKGDPETVSIMLDQANNIGIPAVLKLIERMAVNKDLRRWSFNADGWQKAILLQNRDVLKALLKLFYHSDRGIRYSDGCSKICDSWEHRIRVAIYLYKQSAITLDYLKEILSLVPLNTLPADASYSQDLLIQMGNVDLVRSLKCAKQIASEPNLLQAIVLGHKALVEELMPHCRSFFNRLATFVVSQSFFGKKTEERKYCPALCRAIEIGNLEMVKYFINENAIYDAHALKHAREYVVKDHKETNKDTINQRTRICFYISTLIHIREAEKPGLAAKEFPLAAQDCSKLELEDKKDILNFFKSIGKERLILEKVLGPGFLELLPTERPPAEVPRSEPEQKQASAEKRPPAEASWPELEKKATQADASVAINWHSDSETLLNKTEVIKSDIKEEPKVETEPKSSSLSEVKVIFAEERKAGSPPPSQLETIADKTVALPVESPVHLSLAQPVSKSEMKYEQPEGISPDLPLSPSDESEPGFLVPQPGVSSLGLFHQKIQAEASLFSARSDLLTMYTLAGRVFSDRPDLQKMITEACVEKLALLSKKQTAGSMITYS